MMQLRILGIRGIPAQHGGFETFAEHLALYLAERDWKIVVYCQQDGNWPIHEDIWQGIRRVHIPVSQSGAKGTIVFDWKSIRHACREPGLVLTLGYNTAAFCILYRLKGICNIINMDGIEWKRAKWSLPERAWLYINERLGCWLGNYLVADHPEIANHLATRVKSSNIIMIPYGGDRVLDADARLIAPFGLAPKSYAIVVARPEPENSILEIVKAFSSKTRGCHLAVLGNFDKASPQFRECVFKAASDEVLFLGAIYDKPIVQALRLHARLYIHGHRVGGTNPSLVESLGAQNPILAHDNLYNRWVAGSGAEFFADAKDCAKQLDRLLENEGLLAAMSCHSRQHFESHFTWAKILERYKSLIQRAGENS